MMGADLADGGYRGLYDNDLTGAMPTELGLMTIMNQLYASTILRPACRVDDGGHSLVSAT
jgi:hypothetical protein